MSWSEWQHGVARGSSIPSCVVEVPLAGQYVVPVTGLVEIIHVGSGGCTLSRQRVWSDGGLVNSGRVGSDGLDRLREGETILIETFFESEEEESLYWDRGSGVVLADSVVHWRGVSEQVSCRRSMLDEFAPCGELPDATFFVRFVCRGLALNPDAELGVDLRLLNGRPVDAEEAHSAIPTEPEFVISGKADEIFTWCAGLAWLPELDSVRFERGNVFLLASVAGVLSMAGGFTIPASWVTAVEILVGLVDSHRKFLENDGPPA